jgi:hypothetical protein
MIHPQPAEPTPGQLAQCQPATLRDFVAARTGRLDYHDWLGHIAPAAACTRPIRLYGDLFTVRRTSDGATIITGHRHTEQLPDGVIYKACGNRLAAVCPACARTYQRDAYQVLHTMLVGGKGVPATVAKHPAAFVTFTAPSFGTVHTRVVKQHTCANRRSCDCRPEPCHPRRDTGLCDHDRPAVCWARHDPADTVLGKPLCLDCYDHQHHVVWNLYAPELWRRTTIAINRHLAHLCRERGIPFHRVIVDDRVRMVAPVRITYGKAAEYQTRGAVHFHALIRLDGVDPTHLDSAVPPPAGLSAADLDDAINAAAVAVDFDTPQHRDRPDGWPMAWGEQLDIRQIIMTAPTTGRADITNGMVAGYIAKYATKSTEATGHRSARLDGDSIDLYADPDGDHNARLIHACWRLGRHLYAPGPAEPTRPAEPQPLQTPVECDSCGVRTGFTPCPNCGLDRQPHVVSKPANINRPTIRPARPQPSPYRRLQRWAHRLGYGGHFLTKARRHPVTFGLLRANRITYRRADTDQPAIRSEDHLDEETTLVVGLLTYAGSGWHTIGDAALANTSAAMARARKDAAREELGHEIGRQHTTADRTAA